MRTITSSLLTVILALLLMPAVPYAAPRATQQTKPQTEVQSFVGTIVKSGGAFMLEVGDEKTLYELDDQQKASQFARKKVKVTGTLDAAKKLIHVEIIEGVA